MAKTKSLYPPSPDDVPPELAALSASYRWRAFLVILVVIFFFVLYLGMLGGAIFLAYWGAVMPVAMGTAAWAVPVKIALVFSGSLISLFLIKGFFRHGPGSRSSLFPVSEEEHPKLFLFIERVCEETGANFPKQVFINYEVSAAAGFDPTLLNLVWPTGKNLYIGLGLVNALNLSEFKAVLAHEFGHFSQRSMRVLGYAYTAQHVVRNMVSGYDFFDEMVDRWRHGEPATAWLGWIFYWLTKGISYCFIGIFYLIELLTLALSREMEYHADRFAASVTGSDAIVNALYRIMFADMAMANAMGDMAFAADHKKYSDDLFLHHTLAMERIRRREKKPNLGVPPPLPEDPEEMTIVFEEEDEKASPVMWISHPPNYLRERSVKEIYVRGELDERSAWLLFDNPAKLKDKATFKMYRADFRKSKNIRLSSADKVAEIIAEEYAERTYDECYHGMYDNRILKPGDVVSIAEQCQSAPWTIQQLVASQENLYDETVKSVAKRFDQSIQDQQKLRELESDPDFDEEFKFRGRFYEPHQIRRLLSQLDKEIDECYVWLSDRDQRVFTIHIQMAEKLGARHARELMTRYRFHLAQQLLWKRVQEHVVPIQCVLNFLSRRSGLLEEADFVEIRSILRDARKALAECLYEAKHLSMPKLSNLEEGMALDRYLLKKPLVDNVTNFDDGISGKWLTKFLRQFGEASGNLDQVHFKSLGSILKCQEAIRVKFLEQFSAGSPKATREKQKVEE